ncbi:MAG: serine hydrolase [Ignavibacteriaceae bacterium]
MKQFCFILLIVSSAYSGYDNTNINYSKLYGFWGIEINDTSGNQKFVAYFSKGKEDIECQFHSYFNGIKFSSEIGSEIDFDGEHLSFIANKAANVHYEGKVDSINGIIIGKLKYADGSEREFDLKKISKEKLTTEYPGLSNLTKNANLIEQPSKTNDGWISGTLKESKIDSALLCTMVESINSGQFGKVHSVLIAKNGKLVFEKYFDGFFINDLNSLQSCTKSIGSLLIGIAIDKGFIKNVDEKVLDFFPNYKDVADKKWQDVKLKHLLTMSSGINWERNVHDRIYQISPDVIKTTFEQKFSHKPGEIFEYRNPQSDLISKIIINSSKKTVQDFTKEYLFNPLQIDEFSWTNFKNNDYPLMSGSLALSPRAMLKIGELVMDKGKWNDKQVVSEKWIKKSTTSKIKTDQTFDYGYLWWIGESQSKPGLKAIFAMGISGQLIIIFPGINTVVVTTADNLNKEPEYLLKMVDDYIIKGIK